MAETKSKKKPSTGLDDAMFAKLSAPAIEPSVTEEPRKKQMVVEVSASKRENQTQLNAWVPKSLKNALSLQAVQEKITQGPERDMTAIITDALVAYLKDKGVDIEL